MILVSDLVLSMSIRNEMQMQVFAIKNVKIFLF